MGRQKTPLKTSFYQHLFLNIWIGVGVVFIWRGTWNLIDLYFFPMSETWGNLASIILGLILIYLPNQSFHELGEQMRRKKVETTAEVK